MTRRPAFVDMAVNLGAGLISCDLVELAPAGGVGGGHRTVRSARKKGVYSREFVFLFQLIYRASRQACQVIFRCPETGAIAIIFAGSNIVQASDKSGI